MQVQMDLSVAIYQKYYQAAKARGLYWTKMDWAEHQLGEGATEEQIEDLAENFEHMAAVQKVLAYEISIFVYRHLNGPWGEMVDFFAVERNRFCNEYRERTGYQIQGNTESFY